MEILDRYIEQLLKESTPQAPMWNIEKIKAGKKPSWNYIDGCMIKAVVELYQITGKPSYLEFADHFISYFVNEDGSIRSYHPEEYNLDNVRKIPPGHGHHLQPAGSSAQNLHRKFLA